MNERIDEGSKHAQFPEQNLERFDLNLLSFRQDAENDDGAARFGEPRRLPHRLGDT